MASFASKWILAPWWTGSTFQHIFMEICSVISQNPADCHKKKATHIVLSIKNKDKCVSSERQKKNKVIRRNQYRCRVINRDDVMCILMDASSGGCCFWSSLDNGSLSAAVRWAAAPPAPPSRWYSPHAVDSCCWGGSSTYRWTCSHPGSCGWRRRCFSNMSPSSHRSYRGGHGVVALLHVLCSITGESWFPPSR